MPTQAKNYFDQFETDESQIQNTEKNYFDQFDSEPDEQVPQQKTDNRGMLRKSWDALTNPLSNIPSEFSKSVADKIDKPSEFRSPTRAMIEGFVAGGVEGLGNLGDEAISPLSLLTAGTGSLMSNAGKAGIRGVGKLTEMAGQGLQKYNPILSQFFEPGIIKAGREAIGSGLEMVGNKMRGVGNVVDRYMPNTSSGRTRITRNTEAMNIPPVNESNVPNISGYRGRYADGPEDFIKQVITNEDYADLGKDASNLSSYKVIRNNESESLSPIAKEFMSRRKMKANGDGTFTDVNTGEVLNSKGESVIEINKKPVDRTIDRNSSFFFRNRQ